MGISGCSDSHAQSRQELHELLDLVQKVRAEERRSLAREIHDQLGQLLTAARIEIRSLERRLRETEGGSVTSEPLPELDAALASIDQAIASVQDISILLRPPALDDGGLVGALRRQAAQFQHRSGIACSVQHLEPGYTEPARFVAGELFRICQEALTNVLRHAGATRVLVRISVRGRNLVVRVCDDGAGIAHGSAQAPDAIGIAGMRERATSIRASLCIRGRPGRGTILAIRLGLAAS